MIATSAAFTKLKLHAIFVQFMCGSEISNVKRDQEEETLSREQPQKPKLKLGLNLRTAAIAAEGRQKRNPLEEAEKWKEQRKEHKKMEFGILVGGETREGKLNFLEYDYFRLTDATMCPTGG